MFDTTETEVRAGTRVTPAAWSSTDHPRAKRTPAADTLPSSRLGQHYR